MFNLKKKNMELIARVSKLILSETDISELKDLKIKRDSSLNYVFELLKITSATKEAITYSIPPALKKYGVRFSLDVEESRTRETLSTIICDLDGQKLLPVHKPKKVIRKEGSSLSAFSSTSNESLVAITVNSDTSMIFIRKYKILIQRNLGPIKIVTPFLFKGKKEELPIKKEYTRYLNAIKAAIEKSKCKGCNHVHYALTKEK